MNTTLMGHLIGLRYKLMWAKTRSRNGRIALFFTGYILLIMVGALLGAGGIGAGIGAVKLGQTGMVAKAVLTSVYGGAVMWTLLLGFGMNAVFSETELRRYPLAARERRLVRFFIGIVDPFWFLILLVDLGLVIGLFLMSDTSLGLGLIAALLLLASNYALARAVGMYIDRLSATKAGPAILLFLVMALAFLPQLALQASKRNPAALEPVMRLLRLTPPFAAADAITTHGASAWQGLLAIACWLAVFLAAASWIEKHPYRERVAQAKAIGWNSPYERAGAWFGPAYGVLVGNWLRYYTRNQRFRAMYLLSLPLAGFLTYSFAQKRGEGEWFVSAMGAIPVLAYMGTSRFTVNQFGYVGGGFRRFFLLPTDPGACLRAASYASVMLGAGLLPIGLIAWIALAPDGADPRKTIMLAGSAITGLFLFNGLGIWSTLFGPRKGNYASAMGNDLSLAGNVVVFGCMLGGLFLPLVLKKWAPALISPENWWVALPPVAIALTFYFVSLNLAAPLVQQRRETLMAVVEGKS
ncbi:MAG: hypothetical protein ABSG03_22415 [Bryobacteraceae bacterium]|jgi:hypothetical protein